MLPIKQIPEWSDQDLRQVIESGEKINWDIQLSEDQEEVDAYIETLYTEKESRGI